MHVRFTVKEGNLRNSIQDNFWILKEANVTQYSKMYLICDTKILIFDVRYTFKSFFHSMPGPQTLTSMKQSNDLQYTSIRKCE